MASANRMPMFYRGGPDGYFVDYDEVTERTRLDDAAERSRYVRQIEQREEAANRRRLTDMYEAQIQDLTKLLQTTKVDAASRMARKEILKQLKKVARDAVHAAHFKLLNADKMLQQLRKSRRC